MLGSAIIIPSLALEFSKVFPPEMYQTTVSKKIRKMIHSFPLSNILHVKAEPNRVLYKFTYRVPWIINFANVRIIVKQSVE